MTKIEQLNVFLSERLSAAVNEILDTVSRMMQEYEEETARIRKESEYLKEMLKLTGWSFTELNLGVSSGEKDGMSNLQHKSDSWCQNRALKEESASIKIEPDPTYPAHPDSENTDECPDPDPQTGSAVSEVWNSLKSNKNKAKPKLKKKHYCLYCKKPSLQMTQHLLSAHAKEPEVAKALSYDKKSKERKQLLDLLQSKGNLLHKDVSISRTLVSSKQHAMPGSNDYVQCFYCFGFYSSKNIANHVKRCKHKFPHRAEASNASPMSSAITSPSDSSVIEEVLPCSAKKENPHPECVDTPVSDTNQSTASEQLYTDAETPSEDLGLVGEQLLDLESQNDTSPEPGLVRMDQVHKKSTCSSPAHDQTETIKSEDKKTDTEENGHMTENKSSSHLKNPSSWLDNPSDEEESVAQSTQLHICQHCSAPFCSPYHLRRHEYTHTGERPYWCNECNMGFIQKYRYRNHRMTHHEERYLSVYKDQSRRCKNRSLTGEKPEDSKLHQQDALEATSFECYYNLMS